MSESQICGDLWPGKYFKDGPDEIRCTKPPGHDDKHEYSDESGHYSWPVVS